MPPSSSAKSGLTATSEPRTNAAAGEWDSACICSSFSTSDSSLEESSSASLPPDGQGLGVRTKLSSSSASAEASCALTASAPEESGASHASPRLLSAAAAAAGAAAAAAATAAARSRRRLKRRRAFLTAVSKTDLRCIPYSRSSCSRRARVAASSCRRRTSADKLLRWSSHAPSRMLWGSCKARLGQFRPSSVHSPLLMSFNTCVIKTS